MDNNQEQQTKLYHLIYIGDVGWDEYDSLVVRAYSREDAREIASNYDKYGHWLDNQKTTCEELLAEGKEGVVISSIHSA